MKRNRGACSVSEHTAAGVPDGQAAMKGLLQ